LSDLVPKKGDRVALARSRYFRNLENPDDYSDMSFAPGEVEIIRKKLSNLSTGAFAAIPLKCWPDRCPFREGCPFNEVGKVPGRGRGCLVETNLLKEWTIEFIREYDVHPDSLTDRILVQELAEHELLLFRINSNLAKPEHAELVGDSLVAIDREGRELTRKEVLALVELKLRIQKRRDVVVKMMVGDRQEKYRKQAALKQKEGSDVSLKSANLRKELENIERQAREIGKKMSHEEAIEVTLTPEDLIGEMGGEG
jgi:hypothetical protein